MSALKKTAIGLLAILASAVSSTAQDYPSRPITMIVPFAAGGPSDAIARLVGQSMSEALGQQVVVENVGGAGGTLGAARLARSEPDGYTILIHHVALAAGASLYPQLNYDTKTAFAPLGLINSGPMVLLSRKDLEAADATSLLDQMREAGPDIAVGHAGVGSNSHLCTLLLQNALGAEFTLAAYKGTGPAMNDLMGGTIDLLCDQTTTAIPQIQGETVKAYAVSSAERVDILPDLPTLQEVGLDDFDFTIWHGLYAPSGTPAEIVTALNDALGTALENETLQSRFQAVGTTAFPVEERTPDAHLSRFQAEIETWSTLIDAP